MRILYAEDEKYLSDAISEILKKNKYAIDSVYDGYEAMEYIDAMEYDLIILDVMMPKLDGISVLKKIRAKKIKTPVLLLTAKSEVEDKIEGLDLGADDYMTKPFESKELLARIRALLRRNNEVFDNNINVSNITLNRSKFKVFSNTSKKTFTLNSKEYQILELFMSNPNKFFTKELIMDKIWGYDVDTDISVIFVNISNLRKKLKELNSKFNIKSKRNVGYYMEFKDGKDS